MTISPALAAALRYAAAGWPVFPCKPGSKQPLTAHGFKDASADLDYVRQWVTRWPVTANVAIATGAPGPDVVDVDNKPTGWEALNRLKRAGLLAGGFALVRTRAGGLHAYFHGTSQRCTAGIGGSALDYRATGGYVIAPPSFVEADGKGPGGVYELIEQRRMTGVPFDLAAAKQLLDPPKPARARRGEQLQGDVARRMAGREQWVRGTPEGGRNHSLFVACCRSLDDGVTELGGLVAAAVEAGLPEVEAWRTAASAERQARQ